MTRQRAPQVVVMFQQLGMFQQRPMLKKPLMFRQLLMFQQPLMFLGLLLLQQRTAALAVIHVVLAMDLILTVHYMTHHTMQVGINILRKSLGRCVALVHHTLRGVLLRVLYFQEMWVIY